MTAFNENHAEDRRRQKIQREVNRLDQGSREAAVKALFQSRDGRKYLMWLLQISRALGQQPYNGNDSQTAFACGEMNVGLKVMTHMIETDPSAFADLLKEKADDDRNYRERLRGNQPDFFDEESDSDGGHDDPSVGGTESPFYT